MTIQNIRRAVFNASAASLIGVAAATSVQAQSQELEVLGTWSFMDQWNNIQEPFWNEKIREITDGRVTGNAVSQTDVGLSGTESIRLLNLGVFDVVHGPIAYVSGDAPAIDGIELPMLATTMGEFREIVNAYLPTLEREFDQRFNAKLLSIYTLPRLQMYCNFDDNVGDQITLEDLAGKKIRTFSAALGDFVEAIGATPVSISLAEVVPALQRGVADCGITASLSAYNAKWYQVTTHAITLNLGYSAGFMAMNLDVWNSISANDQQAILAEMEGLWDESWAMEEANESRGENCITSGECDGENGNLIAVNFSDEETAQIKDLFASVVVTRWAERCGTNACAEEWNSAVGAKVGVTAAMPE